MIVYWSGRHLGSFHVVDEAVYDSACSRGQNQSYSITMRFWRKSRISMRPWSQALRYGATIHRNSVS